MKHARRVPEANPAAPPPPDPGETARSEMLAYLAKGRDLAPVAEALRKCSPEARALLGASVPFTTGTTGARCDALRALFAGLAKE